MELSKEQYVFVLFFVYYYIMIYYYSFEVEMSYLFTQTSIHNINIIYIYMCRFEETVQHNKYDVNEITYGNVKVADIVAKQRSFVESNKDWKTLLEQDKK
jgi:hypothetical protein